MQGRVAVTTDVFSLAITISITMSRRHHFVQFDYLHVVRSSPRPWPLVAPDLCHYHSSPRPFHLQPLTPAPCVQRSVPEFPEAVTPEVIKVLSDCVSPDSRHRPSLEALREVLVRFQAQIQKRLDDAALH